VLAGIWRNKWGIALLVAVWLGFECWISWSATCAPSEKQNEEYQTANENCSAFHGPLSATGIFFFESIGDVLDGHGEAVTAVFTVVLAVFTGALWRSTDKLWAAGERQFKLARAMAINQQRQTVESNQIARSSSEHQLRAYLSAMPNHLYGFQPDESVTVRFLIQNHGQTPAYGMTSIANIDVFPYPLPNGFIFEPPPPVGDDWSRGVVYPNAPATGQARMKQPLTRDQLSELMERDDIRVYVYGVVRYKDAFQKDRTTRFCRSINPYFFRKVARGESFQNEDAVFENPPIHNDAD
jgi:hypothetical protein